MHVEDLFPVALENFVPSLQEVVIGEKLDPKHLSVALRLTEDKRLHLPDRHIVLVDDNDKVAEWKVASLRELFRGERVPPKMGDYPAPEYSVLYYFIETHAITFCNGFGDKTDREFDEIYSNLRRRPDGRSLGPLHDFLWQVLALLLGTRIVSQAEFEAVLGRLSRSASTYSMGSVSRNYIHYIRLTLRPND